MKTAVWWWWLTFLGSTSKVWKQVSGDSRPVMLWVLQNIGASEHNLSCFSHFHTEREVPSFTLTYVFSQEAFLCFWKEICFGMLTMTPRIQYMMPAKITTAQHLLFLTCLGKYLQLWYCYGVWWGHLQAIWTGFFWQCWSPGHREGDHGSAAAHQRYGCLRHCRRNRHCPLDERWGAWWVSLVGVPGAWQGHCSHSTATARGCSGVFKVLRNYFPQGVKFSIGKMHKC